MIQNRNSTSIVKSEDNNITRFSTSLAAFSAGFLHPVMAIPFLAVYGVSSLFGRRNNALAELQQERNDIERDKYNLMLEMKDIQAERNVLLNQTNNKIVIGTSIIAASIFIGFLLIAFIGLLLVGVSFVILAKS
ncbi:MAG: hypothetical protein F6K04_01200 [Leptolyngbya sp. SIO4C5]|nr:hypothetical protein [Leptolyngbya sp. SIO4C5]